jgi:hypothetical protein
MSFQKQLLNLHEITVPLAERAWIVHRRALLYPKPIDIAQGEIFYALTNASASDLSEISAAITLAFSRAQFELLPDRPLQGHR